MTENTIKLLKMINEQTNPEEAIITTSKVITYCLEHPEVFDMPKAERMQTLQSIA